MPSIESRKVGIMKHSITIYVPHDEAGSAGATLPVHRFATGELIHASVRALLPFALAASLVLLLQ